MGLGIGSSIKDAGESIAGGISDAVSDVGDEIGRGWESFGKDAFEGSLDFISGGLYSLGKKGYKSYEAAKAAQEAAKQAQKEYSQQQKDMIEAQKLAQEKEAESLRASVSRSRRQAFAERSLISSMSVGVEEDPIYSTETRSVGNTIPNIGGMNI